LEYLGVRREATHCGKDCLIECWSLDDTGGTMVFSSLSDIRQTSGKQGLEVCEIRALVAKLLDVDVNRITDETHFRHDLGTGWLDRLELLILIEDQFDDVEIAEDADEIEVFGDLIRYVENARGWGKVSQIASHAR
jgi:acyl carrier protein